MKKVTDLKKGDRFFYTMWCDFVSTELVGNFYHIQATNGYNDNKFLVIIHKDDEIKISNLTPVS